MQHRPFVVVLRSVSSRWIVLGFHDADRMRRVADQLRERGATIRYVGADPGGRVIGWTG